MEISGDECVGVRRTEETLKRNDGAMVSKKVQVCMAPPLFKARVKSELPALPTSTESKGDKDEEEDLERYVRIMGKGSVDMAMWKASKAGDTALLVKLLHKGARVDWRNENYYNYTALHMASQRGSLPLVRKLIECGARVDARGIGEETPLHEAAHEKHQLVALFLVQQGADLLAKTRLGKTALDFAVDNKFGEALQLMAEKLANQELESQQLRIALANTILERSAEAVELKAKRRSYEKEENNIEHLKSQIEYLKSVIQSRDKEVSVVRERVAKVEIEKEALRQEMEDKVKMANAQRRAAERMTGDAKCEIAGLEKQVDILSAKLKEAYEETNQLDQFISTSVKAVARKNMRRGQVRATLSPRSIKLKTLEKRVKHAEESAVSAIMKMEQAEFTGVEAHKRLVRAEKELYEIRARERKRKYSALKIQRWFLKWYKVKLAKRGLAATQIQRLVRGEILVRRKPEYFIDPGRVRMRLRRMIAEAFMQEIFSKIIKPKIKS